MNTVVWEKFDVKNFSLLMWHSKNWMHEVFLTMNKKVMAIFFDLVVNQKHGMVQLILVCVH